MKKPAPILGRRFIGIGETAKMLQVHPNTLRKWDEKGVLKSVRLKAGLHRRYRKSDIEKIIKDHK
jgi:excisionase family DNA binding protein